MERLKLPMTVCLHTVFILFTICIMESRPSQDGQIMGVYPKDPVIATGNNLTVTCNNSFNLDPSSGKTAEDLYFIFNNIEYKKTSPAFRILDENTVQLHLPAMTRNLTHKHVFCYLDNLDKALDHISIQVLDPPIKPKLEECIVYNWETMKCRWGPQQPEGVVTKLSWNVLSSGHPKYHCAHPTEYTCSWEKSDEEDSFLPTMPYFLSIEANHTVLGILVQSDDEEVDTLHIVKPNPVKHFQISLPSSSTMNLNWAPPMIETVIKRVHYRYYYQSEYESVSYVTKNSSVTLTGLIPNTLYTISVACQPLVKNYTVGGNHYDPVGYWSENVTERIRTIEDVPGAAPKVTDGGFFNDKIHQHNERSVTLLWQDIPKKVRHGNITNWKISYQRLAPGAEKKEVSIENTNKFYYDMQGLHSNQSYKFTINAKTRIGYNESLPLKQIIVASDLYRPASPEEFVVFGNKSGVYLRWEKVEGASGYAVYYCPGSPQQNTCKDKTFVEWIRVEPHDTSISLFVGEGKDVFSYIFAVSCESLVTLENGEKVNVSSGMTWSDCTYQIGKAVKPPKEFEAQPLPDYGMRLTWQKPGCAETGYISGYEIQYCQLDQCDDWILLEIQNDSRHVEIPKLEADMKYMVKIRSLSQTENSVFVELSEPFLVSQLGLTKTQWILIIVGSVIGAILIIVGLIAAIRYCKKKVDMYKNVQIVPPERLDGPVEDENELSGKEDWNEHYNDPTITDQTQIGHNEDADLWKHLNGSGNGQVHLYLNGHVGDRSTQNGWARYEKGSPVFEPVPNSPEQIALLSDHSEASPAQNSPGAIEHVNNPSNVKPVGMENLNADPDNRCENVLGLDIIGYNLPGGPHQDSHNESGLDSGLSSMMAYSAVQPVVNSAQKTNSDPPISGVSGMSIAPYSKLDGQQSAKGTNLPTKKHPGAHSAWTDKKVRTDNSPYSVPLDVHIEEDEARKVVQKPLNDKQPYCNKAQPLSNISMDTAGQAGVSNESSLSLPNKQSVPQPSASYVSDVSQFIPLSSGVRENETHNGYADKNDYRECAEVKDSLGVADNCGLSTGVEGKYVSAPSDKDSGSYGESTSEGDNFHLPHNSDGFSKMAPKASEYITQDLFSQMSPPVN